MSDFYHNVDGFEMDSRKIEKMQNKFDISDKMSKIFDEFKRFAIHI